MNTVRYSSDGEVTEILAEGGKGAEEVLERLLGKAREGEIGVFKLSVSFRKLKKTLYTKRVEIPQPEKVALRPGFPYYIPDFDEEKLYSIHHWSNHRLDERWLGLGQIYLKPEDAAKAAKAMLEREEV